MSWELPLLSQREYRPNAQLQRRPELVQINRIVVEVKSVPPKQQVRITPSSLRNRTPQFGPCIFAEIGCCVGCLIAA
jgi:hypothetical protein